jgi:CysZ protein
MSQGIERHGNDPGPSRTASPLYVLRGALFIKNHRVLWKYAAAPVAISTVVLGLAYYLLHHFFLTTFGGFIGEQWYWQVLYYVALVAAAVLMLVVFFFVFNIVASTIAAPFNELIAEKTEQLVTGTFDETPFSFVQLMKDSGRGIAHSLRMLGTYLSLLVFALVLWVIPGIGGILFTAATILLSSYMLSYEYLGYPMDRRRYTFRDKRRFLRSRWRSTMGFGLGCTIAASIPLVNLLLIPSAVTGAVLLFLELDDQGANSRGDAGRRIP